jgi:hypothetical protein
MARLTIIDGLDALPTLALGMRSSYYYAILRKRVMWK